MNIIVLRVGGQCTQMIMYLIRKAVNPRDIRNALSERRLRAKQRIMGFRLFKFSVFGIGKCVALILTVLVLNRSLFDNTSSAALHQDFAWLLATAIRECVFERMDDPTLKDEEKQNEEERWRRDDWNEQNAFDGETVIHYFRGIEGSGPKLTNLVQSAFQKLYTKITAIFRHDSSIGLNMGALGFLESWSIHFDKSDHLFLHDSQVPFGFGFGFE